MLTSETQHLGDFGLGNFVGEHATYAFALGMHFQHDPSGRRAVHSENALKHIHDELHRGVVVIQQDHLVEGRLLEARRLLFNHKLPLMSCALFTHDLQRVDNRRLYMAVRHTLQGGIGSRQTSTQVL